VGGGNVITRETQIYNKNRKKTEKSTVSGGGCRNSTGEVFTPPPKGRGVKISLTQRGRGLHQFANHKN